MRRIFTSTDIAIAVAFLALGFSTATIFTFWHSNKWPEFYGTLTAALIAATALIFGHYYQDWLIQRRDYRLRTNERNAEAIDLCFWLQHCDAELEFIGGALTRLLEKQASQGKLEVEITPGQFREVISSHFYNELLERAKLAAKLPPEIAGLVAENLYKTFTIIDRVFLLRQAEPNYMPSIEGIEQYVRIISRRREILSRSSKLIETYLIKINALPEFSE